MAKLAFSVDKTFYTHTRLWNYYIETWCLISLATLNCKLPQGTHQSSAPFLGTQLEVYHKCQMN